jgi:hypothetical protein
VTFRRRRAAGVWAAACAAVALGAGVFSATTVAAPLSREPLAVRWSAANDRSRGDLSPSAKWSAPPAALPVLAARELSNPRYRLGAPKGRTRTGLPWWLELWRWVAERWSAFWHRVFGPVRIGSAQAVVVGDVLLVLAAAAVFAAALRLFGGLMLERAPGGAGQALPATAAGAQHWYAGACERAGHGDYASAAQWLFAAALASLSAQGLVDEDRSRTVGEFRSALAEQQAGLLPAFDAVARAFVAATYAQTAVAAAQWDRARDGYLALQNATPS